MLGDAGRPRQYFMGALWRDGVRIDPAHPPAPADGTTCHDDAREGLRICGSGRTTWIYGIETGRLIRLSVVRRPG